MTYSPWFRAITNWTRTLAFTFNGLATVSDENPERKNKTSKIRRKMKMEFQWKAFNSEIAGVFLPAFCQTLVHVGFAVFSTNFFLFLLQTSITATLFWTRTLALAFNLLASVMNSFMIISG